MQRDQPGQPREENISGQIGPDQSVSSRNLALRSRISALLAEGRLKQADLAAAGGIHKQRVWEWLKDPRKDWPLARLETIERALEDLSGVASRLVDAILIPEYQGDPTPFSDATVAPTQRKVAFNWRLPAAFVASAIGMTSESCREVVTIVGDTLRPELRPGDKAILDRGVTLPSPPGIFMIHDGLGIAFVRLSVVVGSSPMQIRISTNTGTDYDVPLDRLDIIGRVMMTFDPR